MVLEVCDNDEGVAEGVLEYLDEEEAGVLEADEDFALEAGVLEAEEDFWVLDAEEDFTVLEVLSELEAEEDLELDASEVLELEAENDLVEVIFVLDALWVLVLVGVATGQSLSYAPQPGSSCVGISTATQA
jgi:hypothetical protein